MTKRDLLEYAMVHIGRAERAVNVIVHAGLPYDPEDFDPVDIIAELSTAIDFLRRVKPVMAVGQQAFDVGLAEAVRRSGLAQAAPNGLLHNGLLAGVPPDVR